jgi:peptide/nickel transport system substrate-binding protein
MMKTKFRFYSVILVAALIAGLATTPATWAQSQIEDPGPGKGAPIVEAAFGGDIQTLNPLIVQDGTSGDVTGNLFPAFIGGDPDTGLPKPGARGAIAKDWKVSEDGKTLTVTIRTDWKWNDGTPITSEDVKYSYDAISSGKIESNLAAFIENIASVEAPAPDTLVVKFKELDCAAILNAANLPVVPSATYKKVYATFEDMKPDHPYNLKPTVSASAFKFSNFRPGEQVTLEADQTFVDAIAGHVIPQGWILKNLKDQTVGLEQFLAGQVTYVGSVPENRQDEMKKLGQEGKIKYNELPAASRHIVVLNIGDPANPQNGKDKDGKILDQGHHPIFGDIRVRQAFALSIDHAALNKGAFNGHGIAIGTPVLPETWAHNANVKAWPFDPERAAKLLDEAGFVDDDNNPDTPRVANDKALYAKPGTKLEFTFTAFSGNASVDAANVLIQDQMKRTGFKMNLETIEFQTAVKKILSQQFDVATFFLGMSRNNPGNTMLSHHGLRGDLVGNGLNAGSWYNKEFEDLVSKSQALPGCDMAERKKMLDRAQEIIHDEVPWYFLNYSMVPFVALADLKNYEPKRFAVQWNLDAWFLPVAK